MADSREEGLLWLTLTDWPELLYERLSQLNFMLVQKDVQSFLKQPDDAQLITQENFNMTLNKYNQYQNDLSNDSFYFIKYL